MLFFLGFVVLGFTVLCCAAHWALGALLGFLFTFIIFEIDEQSRWGP